MKSNLIGLLKTSLTAATLSLPLAGCYSPPVVPRPSIISPDLGFHFGSFPLGDDRPRYSYVTLDADGDGQVDFVSTRVDYQGSGEEFERSIRPEILSIEKRSLDRPDVVFMATPEAYASCLRYRDFTGAVNSCIDLHFPIVGMPRSVARSLESGEGIDLSGLTSTIEALKGDYSNMPWGWGRPLDRR